MLTFITVVFPMDDSKPALLCTLAKQVDTCHKETVLCSDSTCQKPKMKHVFPPLVCFHRTYLSRLSSWESVSLVASQDPTCPMSPVSLKYLYILHHLYFTAVLRG